MYERVSVPDHFAPRMQQGRRRACVFLFQGIDADLCVVLGPPSAVAGAASGTAAAPAPAPPAAGASGSTLARSSQSSSCRRLHSGSSSRHSSSQDVHQTPRRRRGRRRRAWQRAAALRRQQQCQRRSLRAMIPLPMIGPGWVRRQRLGGRQRRRPAVAADAPSVEQQESHSMVFFRRVHARVASTRYLVVAGSSGS